MQGSREKGKASMRRKARKRGKDRKVVRPGRYRPTAVGCINMDRK